MPDCPTCDRGFGDLKSLRIHHYLAHDVRLPNSKCYLCDTSYYSEYKNKYCSTECQRLVQSFEGENNPNYREGKKQETSCKSCGTEFEYYPSEKSGVYCSHCVENTTWQTVPDTPSGENNPAWDGGKVELNCDFCGDTIIRWPSNVNENKNFCGNKCRAHWLSDAYSGSGHPNWKGGTEQKYSRGWHQARGQTLARDNHKCVICGIDKSDLNRSPDVHHIVSIRKFSNDTDFTQEDSHFPNNLISLCVKCHRRAEYGRIDRLTLWSAIDVSPNPQNYPIDVHGDNAPD